MYEFRRMLEATIMWITASATKPAGDGAGQRQQLQAIQWPR